MQLSLSRFQDIYHELHYACGMSRGAIHASRLLNVGSVASPEASVSNPLGRYLIHARYRSASWFTSVNVCIAPSSHGACACVDAQCGRNRAAAPLDSRWSVVVASLPECWVWRCIMQRAAMGERRNACRQLGKRASACLRLAWRKTCYTTSMAQRYILQRLCRGT